MRKILVILPILACLMGCGGTESDFTQQAVSPVALPTSLTQPVDATQGANLRLQTHELTIPANSLSQSTTVSLSTTPQPSVQPRDPDFHAFGTHLVVDLGSADVHHQGLMVHLPAPEKMGGQVFPVEIVDGVFVPLTGQTQSDGTVLAQVKGDAAHFEVGYAEQISFYPPHVNWGSYNGYYFNPASGKFEEFIHLGQVTGTVPNLGPNPMMVVHGLGSNIRKQEFAPVTQFLLDKGIITGAVGFEYDTLDSITANGGYLAQFYAEMAKVNPGATWRHYAHSMGCLVSRECIENNTLPIAATGNVTAFLCGPHTGSGVINILQGSLSLFQEFTAFIVMNDVLDFTNSNFERCQVSAQDPGFQDLADGSPVTGALNQNAAQHHPQFTYNTMAGDDRGLEFDLLDDIIGQDFDDGLVDIASANFSGLGQKSAELAPVSHITAVTSAEYAFPIVQQFLTP